MLSTRGDKLYVPGACTELYACRGAVRKDLCAIFVAGKGPIGSVKSSLIAFAFQKDGRKIGHLVGRQAHPADKTNWRGAFVAAHVDGGVTDSLIAVEVERTRHPRLVLTSIAAIGVSNMIRVDKLWVNGNVSRPRNERLRVVVLKSIAARTCEMDIGNRTAESFVSPNDVVAEHDASPLYPDARRVGIAAEMPVSGYRAVLDHAASSGHSRAVTVGDVVRNETSAKRAVGNVNRSAGLVLIHACYCIAGTGDDIGDDYAVFNKTACHVYRLAGTPVSCRVDSLAPCDGAVAHRAVAGQLDAAALPLAVFRLVVLNRAVHEKSGIHLDGSGWPITGAAVRGIFPRHRQIGDDRIVRSADV